MNCCVLTTLSLLELVARQSPEAGISGTSDAVHCSWSLAEIGTIRLNWVYRWFAEASSARPG